MILQDLNIAGWLLQLLQGLLKEVVKLVQQHLTVNYAAQIGAEVGS